MFGGVEQVVEFAKDIKPDRSIKGEVVPFSRGYEKIPITSVQQYAGDLATRNYSDK
jgi:hypothetical protein